MPVTVASVPSVVPASRDCAGRSLFSGGPMHRGGFSLGSLGSAEPHRTRGGLGNSASSETTGHEDRNGWPSCTAPPRRLAPLKAARLLPLKLRPAKSKSRLGTPGSRPCEAPVSLVLPQAGLLGTTDRPRYPNRPEVAYAAATLAVDHQLFREARPCKLGRSLSSSL